MFHVTPAPSASAPAIASRYRGNLSTPMARKRMTLGYHYVHGLRAAIHLNAQAFAFSIMITSTFGIVDATEGDPTLGPIYAFMAGAIVGFVAVLVVASRGFSRDASDAEPPRVLAL